MNQVSRFDEDCLCGERADQPIHIPQIPFEIPDENNLDHDIIFDYPIAATSVLLAAGFVGFLIGVVRAANPAIDDDFRAHGQHAECCMIAAAGVVEFAAIKLTQYRYSFFSLANRFASGALEDIKQTMFEDDPDYYLVNAMD